MLFNTYAPGKFAFSQESDDLAEISMTNLINSSNSKNFKDFKHWGIIGVPFDSTCSYHHGSRYGPIIIREASFGFEQYNIRFDSLFNAEFYDFGDLNVIHGNCKKTCKILEDSVNELINAKIKPILIGGEHSVSIGSLSAIANKFDSKDLSDVTILHLDAHMDIIDTYLEERDSHATIMRRVYELNPKELIQIGIRSCSLEEKEFIESQDNINSFLAKDLLSKNSHEFDNLINSLKSIKGNVYISIDMDVMDPSFAPSLGNPAPGGISPTMLEEVFEVLASNNEINFIGFDLVEVATNKLGDITAILAAKIIYDFLTLFA